MDIKKLQHLFLLNKEKSLYHRYITNAHIHPLFEKLKEKVNIVTLGESVLNKPIFGIKLGHGKKRLLLWSQMHGNESTTTKAIFDLLNTLTNDNDAGNDILKTCTLFIIPILNPDGAEAYTRFNANAVDLNRDAQDLTQPESKVLRQAFMDFKPHFCYNLHGQRTIFSAGNTNKPATVSFLAPAQDKDCTITGNRRIAMEIISEMNSVLQNLIPNQVGVYDDAFNINCVGDTFQNSNVPTMLFEAGHHPNDYEREMTREFIYIALLKSIDYIAKNDVQGNNYKGYFSIPENEKIFFDIIIRRTKFRIDNEEKIYDVGILYQEILRNGTIEFIPKVEKIENLDSFFGHKEIDANYNMVYTEQNEPLQIGYSNVFVMMNNEKISLISK